MNTTDISPHRKMAEQREEKKREILNNFDFHWDALSEEETGKILDCVDPGRICNLPIDYLLQYACEDTDSTFLLYENILRPVLDAFPSADTFHRKYHCNLIEQVAIQQLLGVKLDMEKYWECKSLWLEKKETALKDLHGYKGLNEGIAEFHRLILKSFLATEPPEKYKKGPVSGKEPEKYKKDGKTVQLNWLKWREKADRIANLPKEETHQWKRWEEKKQTIERGIREYGSLSDEERKGVGLFRLSSGENLRWLFYEYYKFPVIVYTKSKGRKVDTVAKPATDGDALRGFGELGKRFMDLAEATKMLQFCESLEKASDLSSGTYHPVLKVPGTFTGRLSGDGGFNWQNPPKSREFLEVFGPRPNTVLIDFDACALEPTVLAELSRDPGLLSVYGPQASPFADIYLLVGNAFPGIGEVFRAAGYDPENPSEEAVKRCKKEHKDLRGVCKTLKLSADYGCGAKKWHATLRLDGFSYTLDQCYTFHNAFWTLFKAIRVWEESLRCLWEKNGGWLLDGLGMPFCVAEHSLKDLVNRCVQRTGHEILMIYQEVVTRLLTEANIKHSPWCYDYHDQLILEVESNRSEEAVRIMGEDSFQELNRLLLTGDGSTVVKLKGSGGVVQNLAESKLQG